MAVRVVQLRKRTGGERTHVEGIPVTAWHVWRIDRGFFGVQNLGAETVTRVGVTSSRNEVMVMGYITKEYVRPLEWFMFYIAQEFQSDCHEVTVTWRSGRTRKNEIVGIIHAIRQRPSLTPIPLVADPPDRDVYLPPQE